MLQQLPGKLFLYDRDRHPLEVYAKINKKSWSPDVGQRGAYSALGMRIKRHSDSRQVPLGLLEGERDWRSFCGDKIEHYKTNQHRNGPY